MTWGFLWLMLALKLPIAALIYLVRLRKLTNAIYQSINDVSKATATRHLQDMISKGIISFQSKGACALYSLANPFPKDLDITGKIDGDLI